MTKLPNSPIMSFYTSSSSTAGDPPSDSFLQPLELSPTRVITSRKTRSKEAVLRLLLTQSTVLRSFDIEQKDLIPVDRWVTLSLSFAWLTLICHILSLPRPCDPNGTPIPLDQLTTYNESHDWTRNVFCWCSLGNGGINQPVRVFSVESKGDICLGCSLWLPHGLRGCSYFGACFCISFWCTLSLKHSLVP